MSFRPVNDRSSQLGLGVNGVSISRFNASNTPHNTAASERTNTGSRPLQKQPSPNSDSQATALSSNSNESNRVFTPSTIERTGSAGAASSGQASSQDSQLLQLSQLAAAREKMPDVASRSSVKRTADGMVKGSNTSPPDSPPRPSSHSRNISGVSAASTASSRVAELSSELKTRLSYAMLKVHNGWQSRTIDEVETLASTAASPTSSNSTAVAGRAQSSTSPKVRTLQRATPPSSYPQPVSSQRAVNTAREPSASPGRHSPNALSQGSPSLAPPVFIQPQPTETHPRRTTDPRYTPAYLAPQSYHVSPHTPAVPALHITPNNRNLRAVADPMATSPTHSKSEEEALQALMFMSSPGNSANMKIYQPSPQPLSNLRNGSATSVPSTQRKALPTSAPKRKGLPNGRPAHSSQPLPTGHSPQKRVGFERSPTNPVDMMDLDGPASARHNQAPLARMANRTYPRAKNARFSQGFLSESAYHKPGLDIEHLDKELDRLAAEASSSDSESEILLPDRR